jgi:hypothetical protein
MQPRLRLHVLSAYSRLFPAHSHITSEDTVTCCSNALTKIRFDEAELRAHLLRIGNMA